MSDIDREFYRRSVLLADLKNTNQLIIEEKGKIIVDDKVVDEVFVKYYLREQKFRCDIDYKINSKTSMSLLFDGKKLYKIVDNLCSEIKRFEQDSLQFVPIVDWVDYYKILDKQIILGNEIFYIITRIDDFEYNVGVDFSFKIISIKIKGKNCTYQIIFDQYDGYLIDNKKIYLPRHKLITINDNQRVETYTIWDLKSSISDTIFRKPENTIENIIKDFIFR
jgi:hypothetical protein